MKPKGKLYLYWVKLVAADNKTEATKIISQVHITFYDWLGKFVKKSLGLPYIED